MPPIEIRVERAFWPGRASPRWRWSTIPVFCSLLEDSHADAASTAATPEGIVSLRQVWESTGREVFTDRPSTSGALRMGACGAHPSVRIAWLNPYLIQDLLAALRRPRARSARRPVTACDER